MPEALLGNIVRFIELLRVGGIDVHAGRAADVAIALDVVGLSRRVDVRAALRGLLIHRHDDLPAFDEAFDRFWRAVSRGHSTALPLMALGERPRVAAMPSRGTAVRFEAHAAAASAAAASLAAAAWSDADGLRTKDFATLSAGELAQAEALLARMPWRLGVRRTRRWSRAPTGRVDLRGAVRRNIRHGGELLDLPRVARLTRPRPVVVLADVSGSMERYARMLLQFVHGMTTGPHTVESFVFATRLTRVTRDVGRRRRDGLLSSFAQHVTDWGGGTRIGEALRAFNVGHARRVMRQGPVVLIISDGWDRGDPDRLAQELAHLRRRCRRLVWLNPLLGSETYEPLTRGMQAALPLVDDFLPVHNLASLEQLAQHLQALNAARPRHTAASRRRRVHALPRGTEPPHAD